MFNIKLFYSYRGIVMHIVLVGMMGVGKSSIGRSLSDSLKIPFNDIDHMIEKSESRTITRIFRESGEEYFREREEKFTLMALQQEIKSIISLGGGAFMNKMIRESVLDQSISIWLKLDIKTIRKRIEKNKKRPLVFQNTQVGIEKMLENRSIYYSMSKVHISCDGKDIKDCTTEIINKITEVKLNEKN